MLILREGKEGRYGERTLDLKQPICTHNIFLTLEHLVILHSYAIVLYIAFNCNDIHPYMLAHTHTHTYTHNLQVRFLQPTSLAGW